MDNQEEDVQVEQEIAEQEETTDTEVEETPEEETITVSKEKFKAMQKKAIAFDAKKKTPQINNTLSREEAILIAKGRNEDELDLLHTIAKGKGVSLLEAEKNPLFIAYEEKQAEEKKKEDARLGVSKSSTYSEEQSTFKKPGLTEEEHKALVRKSMSK